MRKPRLLSLLGAALAAVIAAPVGMADTAASKETLERGRQVFTKVAQPSCALCHKLEAAGAAGTIGPSLDELKPDRAKVRQAVLKGAGVMPPFADKLSPQDIEAVTQYVAKAIAGSN